MKRLIRWVEIPANNFEKAVEFYNAVFGLELEALDFGHEKMACFPNDEGAISLAPDFKPSKDGVLVSFHTDDMEKAIATANANGGKTVKPKTKIEAEGRGYFALILDCEGNRIGLYSDK